MSFTKDSTRETPKKWQKTPFLLRTSSPKQNTTIIENTIFDELRSGPEEYRYIFASRMVEFWKNDLELSANAIRTYFGFKTMAQVKSAQTFR